MTEPRTGSGTQPDPRRPNTTRLWRGVVHAVRDPQMPRHFSHIGDRDRAVEAIHARRVVDLVLRICEMGLATGSPASDVTGYGVRVADALGVTANIDITSTSVTVSQAGTDFEDPVTSVRIVQVRTQDYQRLALLEQLVDDIVAGHLDVDPARERLAAIAHASHAYRPWVQSIAMAVLGAAVVTSLGGGWREVVAGFVVTALVAGAVVVFGRLGWSLFFTQAGGSAIATLAALGLMVGNDGVPLLQGVSPSLVVASGIVSLLTGLSLVASSRDALDGFHVTAAAGLLEVVVATGGIVVGIMSALWVGIVAGVPLYLTDVGGRVGVPLWLGLLAAGLMALAIGVGAHVRPRGLLPFFGLGALAWLVHAGALALFDERIPATAMAAIAVGAVAQLGHARWRMPVVALITAGIIPLLPGLTLYRGLYGLLQDVEDGGHVAAPGMLLTALMVGVALAVGTSLGSQVVRGGRLAAWTTSRAPRS
ncbi:threonine/serine exporter family protein [Propioniciclava sp. MC1683]|uniref:threonine/serine ThrE exporter family protein n=1 Tax=Propioniciclava sp. MC1683 TaxID=2760309 RepID=UPI0015FEC5B7|nr:threonine/serine exporter family protein [Propioniciclava sp. MC1683]MBB1502334.1 threonine/serine exporter family protein [Propioniciclava sp. MC1683]